MKNGTVRPGYYLLGADGDVLEDIYVMDTTDMTLNFIEIDSWDTLNKRVEGHFSFTGVIQEPRYNPINPNKVQLASGRFWLKLP